MNITELETIISDFAKREKTLHVERTYFKGLTSVIMTFSFYYVHCCISQDGSVRFYNDEGEIYKSDFLKILDSSLAYSRI